jgi:predicted RNase H-like HicB family nuclease
MDSQQEAEEEAQHVLDTFEDAYKNKDVHIPAEYIQVGHS